MSVYERYTYPVGGVCLDALPQHMWTRRAQVELDCEWLSACEALLVGSGSLSAWCFIVRTSLECLDSCTDLPNSIEVPAYGACLYNHTISLFGAA